MNLTEYQPLAMRTAKIMDKLDMLVHGAMGCGSEPGEMAETLVKFCSGEDYSTANLAEELGDGVWFATYICEALGISIAEVCMTVAPSFTHRNFSEETAMALAATCGLTYCASGGEILTIVKAHKFYGKPLDTVRLEFMLALYMKNILDLCIVFDIPASKVLSSNVSKLAKRYPDKYSDTAAIARADKEEPASYIGLENKDPQPGADKALTLVGVSAAPEQPAGPSEADVRIFERAVAMGIDMDAKDGGRCGACGAYVKQE